MASAIIHIAVASELNKVLSKNNSQLFIGTIAPDISKHVGISRDVTHFITGEKDIPDIDLFLKKYRDNLGDDFVLGYYIHLYVDYLWFKYFIPEVVDKNVITKIDGKKVYCTPYMLKKYIYNDYTNINQDVIDKYNLDLKIFYNDLPLFVSIIDEIPMDRINVIVDQMGIIIENASKNKDFIFNMDNVNNFIDLSVQLIKSNLVELGIM